MKNIKQERRIKNTLEKEEKAVNHIKNSINEDFFNAIRIINDRKGKIVVTGVGKSGFIGMKMSATFTSLGNTSLFLHPVEALHGDSGAIEDGDVIVAISFSGESQEIIKIIKHLKKSFNVRLVSITGNETSSLADLSDEIILINIFGEGCPIELAPMASTTTTLVIGDLIASAITEPNSFEKHHFAKFHPGGSLGLSLVSVKDVMITGNSLPTVLDTLELKDALKKINEKKMGVVGVVAKNGKLLGIITDGDIRRFFTKNTSILGKKASDAMKMEPKIISDSSPLKSALEVMEEFKITSLFVVDVDQNPIGVIHMHDIINNYVI